MGLKWLWIMLYRGITIVIFCTFFAITGCLPEQTTPPDLNTLPPPSETAAPLPTNEVIVTTLPQVTRVPPAYQFDQISDTYSFSGSLNPGTVNEHKFLAEADDMLTVAIKASDNAILFELFDVYNQQWGSTQGTNKMMIILPNTGEYWVRVKAPEANGVYGYGVDITLSENQIGQADNLASFPTATIVPGLSSATAAVMQLPLTQPPPTAVIPITPQPDRIEFGSMNTSETIPGQLNGSHPKKYIFQGNEGHRMTIYANVSQPGFEIEIFGQDETPIGTVRSGETFTQILPKTQEYLLNLVSLTGNVIQNYSFTLSVVDQSPSNAGLGEEESAERISLHSGSPSIDVSGTLYANNSKTYVLRVLREETVTIDVTPDDKSITITMRGEDGTNFPWVLAGATFSEVMPKTQDYFISLTLPRNSNETPYVLTVQVD